MAWVVTSLRLTRTCENCFFDENSFPFGREGEYRTIKFFDTNPATAAKNKTYVVTNQWEFPKSSYAGGKRLDVVLLINGIPMVIGEVKTATKASVTWADGARTFTAAVNGTQYCNNV